MHFNGLSILLTGKDNVLIRKINSCYSLPSPMSGLINPHSFLCLLVSAHITSLTWKDLLTLDKCQLSKIQVKYHFFLWFSWSFLPSRNCTIYTPVQFICKPHCSTDYLRYVANMPMKGRREVRGRGETRAAKLMPTPISQKVAKRGLQIWSQASGS